MRRSLCRTRAVKFMWNSKRLARWSCSLLLMMAATMGLISESMYNVGVQWHSPTMTYQGYLSVEYSGIYRYVEAIPTCSKAFPPCFDAYPLVFYLETDNGLLVRLILQCGLEDCYRANQVPLTGGTRIHVKGTLIEPSQWPAPTYEPRLYFVGDLYVRQYSSMPL